MGICHSIRSVCVSTILFLLISSSAGCSGPASGSVVYKPPFLPIEFSLDSHGHISVGSGRSFTTFLGTFSVEGEWGKDLITSNSVLVLVTHRVDGRPQQDGYRIGGTTTLTTCLDGQFFQRVSANKVEISALSGVSTIRVFRGDVAADECSKAPPGGGGSGQAPSGRPIPCPPQVSARLPGGEGLSAVLTDYYRTTRFYLYICRSTQGRHWYQGVTQFRPDHWLVVPAQPLNHGYRMTTGDTTIVIHDDVRMLDIRQGGNLSGDSILEFAHYVG